MGGGSSYEVPLVSCQLKLGERPSLFPSRPRVWTCARRRPESNPTKGFKERRELATKGKLDYEVNDEMGLEARHARHVARFVPRAPTRAALFQALGIPAFVHRAIVRCVTPRASINSALRDPTRPTPKELLSCRVFPRLTKY